MEVLGKVYEGYYFGGFGEKMEEEGEFVRKLKGVLDVVVNVWVCRLGGF